MSVYVDELVTWPHARGPFVAGACHLTADTLDELHRFAHALGLKRRWFQPRPHPHYDLTVGMRRRALACGAVFAPARAQAIARRARRQRLGEGGAP